MKVEIENKGHSREPYPVKALNLKDALKVLNSRVIKGEIQWGTFSYSRNYDYLPSNPKGSLTHLFILKQSKMFLPKWRNLLNQPQSCQDEWNKMKRALERHEERHKSIFEKNISWLAAQMRNVKEPTLANVGKEFKVKWAEVKKEQDKFDEESDHGFRDGVELNLNNCKEPTKGKR